MLKIVAALALLLVLVAADASLLHADNPTVIPGSYIIILHEHLEVMDRDEQILALQDQMMDGNETESEIGFRYKIDTLVGFSARLNKKLLAQQLQHPNVKYIECDQMMSIINEQEPRSPSAIITQSGATWGLGRTSSRARGVSSYYYNSNAGSGANVYVLDTGILTTHNDFGGRASSVFNAISGESSQDLNGHGTHCAGTVGGNTYGVAKKARLFSVKVLSATGSGTNAGVIAGIDWVTNNAPKPSIASMSLGGGISTATDNAVANSINRGVFYAIAAGNSNANACNYSPARVATATTVGATANTDARSTFSNFGTCVDIFAPGTDIASDWIGSNSATRTISGTSMACPHVAGVAALTLALNPTYTPAQLNNWLVQYSTANVVTNPGSGSPNRLLFSNPTA